MRELAWGIHRVGSYYGLDILASLWSHEEVKYKPEIVTAFFNEHLIPTPDYEHRFHPTRKWRFDIAWPTRRLAIEVDGGIWIGGRHSRGATMKKDWEKSNAAVELGWRILKCEPRDLCTNDFAELIKRCMKNNL